MFCLNISQYYTVLFLAEMKILYYTFSCRNEEGYYPAYNISGSFTGRQSWYNLFQFLPRIYKRDRLVPIFTILLFYYFTFSPPNRVTELSPFCPDITELIGTINLLPDLMAPLQKMLRGAEKALESKLKQGRADHFYISSWYLSLIHPYPFIPV